MQPLAAIIRVTLAGLGIRVRDFWDPPGGGCGTRVRDFGPEWDEGTGLWALWRARRELGYGTLGPLGIRVRDFRPKHGSKMLRDGHPQLQNERGSRCANPSLLQIIIGSIFLR